MASLSNLRDVLRYGQPGSFGTESGGWDNPLNLVNNSEMSDADFYRQHLAGTGSSFDFGGRDGSGTAQWGIKQGSILDRINQAAPGAAQINMSRDGDSGGMNAALNLDYAQLPQTKFGSAQNVSAVQDSSKLINPDLVYDDPTYGKITHSANMRSGNEMVFPLLMAALTMGAGGIGAFGPLGSQMMALVKGARSLGSGKSPLGSLGALSSLFSLGGGG